jgi:hypothetical protein
MSQPPGAVKLEISGPINGGEDMEDISCKDVQQALEARPVTIGLAGIQMTEQAGLQVEEQAGICDVLWSVEGILLVFLLELCFIWGVCLLIDALRFKVIVDTWAPKEGRLVSIQEPHPQEFVKDQ